MEKVGIIGLGRFGRFWAEVLSHSFDVYGYTRTIPQEAPCTLLSLEDFCTLPTIFICVPMQAVQTTLQKMAPLIAHKTLVIDTCSVKIEPVRWMNEHLPSHTEIIASHPMFGPDSARKGRNGSQGRYCLANLPIMMHPERVSPERYEFWRSFFISIELEVVEMSPEEHDKQAAMSQALTHMLGKTLNTMGIEETPIGTLWYRKLLAICKQVAKDTPELFYDMQTLNPYASIMRQDFERAWDTVTKSLTDTANHG